MPTSAVIVETQGQGARVRSAPGSQAPVLTVLQEGVQVELSGQQSEIEDRIWFEVRTPNGLSGWIAGDLLAPAQSSVNR